MCINVSQGERTPSRIKGLYSFIVMSTLCSAVTGKQQALSKHLLDAKMNYLTVYSLMLEKVSMPQNNLFKGKFWTKLTNNRTVFEKRLDNLVVRSSTLEPCRPGI